MFFVKFREYRGAKSLGFHTWKEARRFTKIQSVVSEKCNLRLNQMAFAAFRSYQEACQEKRQRAFSALIFNERWSLRWGLAMVRENVIISREEWQKAC